MFIGFIKTLSTRSHVVHSRGATYIICTAATRGHTWCALSCTAAKLQVNSVQRKFKQFFAEFAVYSSCSLPPEAFPEMHVCRHVGVCDKGADFTEASFLFLVEHRREVRSASFCSLIAYSYLHFAVLTSSTLRFCVRAVSISLFTSLCQTKRVAYRF